MVAVVVARSRLHPASGDLALYPHAVAVAQFAEGDLGDGRAFERLAELRHVDVEGVPRGVSRVVVLWAFGEDLQSATSPSDPRLAGLVVTGMWSAHSYASGNRGTFDLQRRGRGRALCFAEPLSLVPLPAFQHRRQDDSGHRKAGQKALKRHFRFLPFVWERKRLAATCGHGEPCDVGASRVSPL